MKKINIITATLFLGLVSSPFITRGATLNESPTTTTPIPSHAVVHLEQEPSGFWSKTKRCFTGCARRTQQFGKQVLPMMEFALPFIQDPELRRTLQGAINVAKKGTKLIEFNEDGSLKLPDGQEVANAVLLVVSDKISLLTDESKMFLALLMSRFPPKDYKMKILLAGYLAAVDDPKTPFQLGFDADEGKVQLLNEHASFPVESLHIFGDTSDLDKELIRTYFTEYMDASRERTATETANGTRATGIFLPKDGFILGDYAELIERNVAFKLANLAEAVVKGETSVRQIIDSAV